MTSVMPDKDCCEVSKCMISVMPDNDCYEGSRCSRCSSTEPLGDRILHSGSRTFEITHLVMGELETCAVTQNVHCRHDS